MFSPPIAFFVYLALVGLLYAFGRQLAGRPQPTPLKSSVYAGGEAPPIHKAAPGYRPYFTVALFFAVLHLGALVLGTTAGLPAPPTAALYLVGLFLVLLALILG